MIDFYPKDIKEIAAGGGSWGFIASQEPLARRSQIYQNLLKNLGAIMQIIQDKSQKT